MNLKKYKQKRDLEKKALELEYSKHRTHCLDCLRSVKACLCNGIESFSTQFEFRILMHPKEARKESVGTGRYTNIVLNNCKIIIGENFDDNKEVQNIIKGEKYYPFLLYPGSEAVNITYDNIDKNKYHGKAPLIFIIDGTWPCAKSMMRDSITLHDLPRISFDSNIESKFTIKHQPARYCLSTIESVYQLLSGLERQGLENTDNKKEMLLKTLDRMVAFQVECATDPSKNSYRKRDDGYKKPHERQSSKRWDHRMILFEEKNYD